MTAPVHPEDNELRKFSGKFGEYFEFLTEEKNTFAWMFREFTTGKSRRHMRNMFILLLLVTLLVLLQPVLIGAAIQSLGSKNLHGLFVAIGLCVCSGLLHHILSAKEGEEREWVLGLNLCRLDEAISEHLFKKPLGQHERFGTQLNYASIDKGKWKAIGIIDTIIFRGVPSLLSVICAIVGLWFIRPEFGAFVTAVTAVFMAWSLWLSYQVGYNMMPVEREFRRLNRIRVERWEKIQRVITSGMAASDMQYLSRGMSDNMAKDRVFWIWLIRQFNIRGFLLQRLLSVSALAYGSYLVWNGDWEIGYLFPLTWWTESLNTNLNIFTEVERHVARDITPVKLMIDALDLKPAFDMERGEILKRNGPLEVRFEHVSHEYKDEHGLVHPVLKDVSLALGVGEKVALLGPSGAGKTTLMKLLLRFEDPSEGSVLINGRPLLDFDLVSYMRQVGYIPQASMIIDGTVGENLLYGASHEKREELLVDDATELWKLMQSLKIDFGKRLFNGLDTLVGRHGLKLSGGQAQRVMIGSAVAKNPRLMVIDEATSSLDSTTEREVQEGLAAALNEGTTALIVAHRLSTVRNLCDRFVVMRPLEGLADGESQIEAVASSFEELVKISPTFRRLAGDQGLLINQ